MVDYHWSDPYPLAFLALVKTCQYSTWGHWDTQASTPRQGYSQW